MCIRALDYIPPVDMTFGDYLRGIITADFDLYPEDPLNYRRAMIEAFLAWGIKPEGMPIVTEQSLLWPSMNALVGDTLDSDLGSMLTEMREVIEQPTKSLEKARVISENRVEALGSESFDKALRDARKILKRISKKASPQSEDIADFIPLDHAVLDRNLLELGVNADRESYFLATEMYAELFWYLFERSLLASEVLAKTLGLTLSCDAPKSIRRSKYNERPTFKVNSVRMAKRLGMRDELESEYVVEIVQTRYGFDEAGDQHLADDADQSPKSGDFKIRAGVTLLIDAKDLRIRRIIRSRYRVDDDEALAQRRAYEADGKSVTENAFDTGKRRGESAPFAALHRCCQDRRDKPWS